MTKDQAKRILDRARDGNDISSFEVCEALRTTGDIQSWIAKDNQYGVAVRYSSSTDVLTSMRITTSNEQERL